MTQGAAGEHSSAGVSTVFPLLARSPPPSRQPHPLGLSSLLPPAPPPPFQARPWPPNSRSSLRERAAARRFSRASGGGGSAPTFATQGLAAWAPTTGLRRARVSLPLAGAEGSAVCVSKPHTVPNWGLKSRFHLRHSVPSPTQPQGTQSPVPGLGPGTSPKLVEIGLRRGQSRAKIVIFWVASEASGGSSTAMTQVEAFCQCSLSPGNF